VTDRDDALEALDLACEFLQLARNQFIPRLVPGPAWRGNRVDPADLVALSRISSAYALARLAHPAGRELGADS
jgi:hypothetical protein